MPEDLKDLSVRVASLEQRLGVPRMAVAAKLARAAADTRREFLSPKITSASKDLCEDIKALAGRKGLLAEYTLWEIGPDGNPAACCCCCCCCCC